MTRTGQYAPSGRAWHPCAPGQWPVLTLTCQWCGHSAPYASADPMTQLQRAARDGWQVRSGERNQAWCGCRTDRPRQGALFGKPGDQGCVASAPAFSGGNE